MSNSTEMALVTIADLKANFPDYFVKLYPQCQVCKNIISSYECDLCEDFNMFVKVKADDYMFKLEIETGNAAFCNPFSGEAKKNR